MPAVRLSHRRRSSIALSAFNPVRPGIYGIQSPSPRAVTFAPNVTPGTFTEPDLPSSTSTPEPSSPTSQLFPPSELPPPPPTRRRAPPGKRRSLGYIPRPPNAFMLFRADFVRQKHVPGSIETNHGSLSKIIGNCWRSLPLEERRVWETKAKQAKAAHKATYPDYRFRPVHNKNKEKKKEKAVVTAEDERRCEEVAQLLLEGKKGDELAAAIRKLDEIKVPIAHAPIYPNRRSSSVPLPDSRFNPITLPAVPFFANSRPGSPVSNISRSARLVLGQRRASSVQPIGSQSWGAVAPAPYLQRDESPLPEVDASLFDPSFLDSNFAFSGPQTEAPFNINDLFASLPPNAHSPQDFGISPLDHISPHNLSLDVGSHNWIPSMSKFMDNNQASWLPTEFTSSQPSSSYSGSPAQSDQSLPLLAPQPQHAGVSHDMWKEMTSAFSAPEHDGFTDGLGLHAMQSHQQQGCGDVDQAAAHLANYSAGLDAIFDGSFNGMDTNTGASFAFDYNEMTREF
ncbi:hypothetical protein BV22DRAFT_1028907 [Leucogyrophana mollusca]|uniref:Uncharacterized protein n=1 Tax=Leucogyrophana mollusca TaxID=85980 RepID=A0ACB8BYL9_9AGAM|nr:hypothetical protein BV22DRAFT_1028907 [Leucogyrophana mollusca]